LRQAVAAFGQASLHVPCASGTEVKTLVLLAAMLIGAAVTAAASGADFDRGKLLYNARCVGCHDQSVHNRPARKALTIEGIRAQVRRWDARTGGAWREEEVNDVAADLNELFYRYPCPPPVCPEKKAGAMPSPLTGQRVGHELEGVRASHGILPAPWGRAVGA
jgi:hypothetical protein